jgi:uncharacterized protein (TIGR00251 family)
MADKAGKPFSVDGDTITLAVRITPKASRDAFGGVIEMPDGRHALSVRIAAPPVDGAANAALIAFLAKSLSVSRSDVIITVGETSRFKLLKIHGDGAATEDQLQAFSQS